MASTLQLQKFSFESSTTRGKWRWLTVADLTGASPSYRIEGVQSPYGRLRDEIPIEGSVVVDMAASISTVSTAFSPSILIGPPTPLSFVVDEGRGVSVPLSSLVTNNGSFASLLSADLSPSAAYVLVSEDTLGGLSQNESAPFEVSVDSTNLSSVGSPYAASVTVSSASATNSPQVLPINIVVRPKATITLLPLALTFTVVKPLTGPFPVIADQTFDITNSGPAGSVLEFLVQKLTGLSPWLTGITPTLGSLASGATSTVTVSVSPAESLLTGTYTETLRVSGYSTNNYQDVTVTLVVSLCLP